MKMETPNLEVVNDDTNPNRIKEGDNVIIKKLHDKTFGRLIKIDSKW